MRGSGAEVCCSIFSCCGCGVSPVPPPAGAGRREQLTALRLLWLIPGPGRALGEGADSLSSFCACVTVPSFIRESEECGLWPGFLGRRNWFWEEASCPMALGGLGSAAALRALLQCAS